ncbi:MAG: hypothetical protein ACLS7Z_06295 [Christensenellales bacterium]
MTERELEARLIHEQIPCRTDLTRGRKQRCVERWRRRAAWRIDPNGHCCWRRR